MRALLAAAMLCVAASAARAETVTASCYGTEHGQTRTATGARYLPFSCPGGVCGAAHRTLPIGTLVRVCMVDSPRANAALQPIRAGRCITVRINDRGPYHRDKKTKLYDRDLDLSLGGCRAIGSDGRVRVELEVQ
jgi:rare lipoprotein A (peptidoglycan hydrolase)